MGESNPNLPFSVSFIYGTKDWMDTRGSREIVRANPFYASGESQIYVLPGATHHLWYDCPKSFVEVITNDMLGISKHIFQIKKYTTNYVDKDGNETHTDTEFYRRSQQFDKKNLTFISVDSKGRSYLIGTEK